MSLFDEPLDPQIACQLLSEDEFLMLAYVKLNTPERVTRAVQQLARLVPAFRTAELPELGLNRMVALLWHWAGRFYATRAPEVRQAIWNAMRPVADCAAIGRLIRKYDSNPDRVNWMVGPFLWLDRTPNWVLDDIEALREAQDRTRAAFRLGAE